MIGGLALVAYPAEYRNSGVMTFLVNHQGNVYEKDLGPNTARVSCGHDGIQSGQYLAAGNRCGPAAHRSKMKTSTRSTSPNDRI
jgi:hypothetical protein